MNRTGPELSRQQGFTLVELVLSVAVLGIMMAATAPLLSTAFTFMDAAKRDENTLTNRKLANAMVDFSRNRSGVYRGRLPAPVNNSDSANLLKGALYDPLDTTTPGALALAEQLRTTGVPVGEINTDGGAAANVRVYQLLTGLTYAMPLYATTGPQVNLTYDTGILYSTRCSRLSACYTGATLADPPGDSAQLTAANLSSWTTEGSDYGAIAFNTLDEQKTLLRVTAGRLNRLSDKFVVDFHNKLRLAAADSQANFFPTNTGGLNLGNLAPGTNMGCRDGWYNLAAANVDILTQLGMNKLEHGVTAWGGVIDFCRDYDPQGTGTHNAAPHYAALRINRNTTSLGAPTVINDAVIVTF